MHHHKDFLFNHDSVWIKPTYTKIKGDWEPTDNKENYVDVLSANNTILEFSKYYPDHTIRNFIRAMGLESTEYFLNYNDFDVEYMGCSSYGRYLLINNKDNVKSFKISDKPTEENISILSGQEQCDQALEIFETYDIITNFDRHINCSIEEQYLQHQSQEHWHKFKEAIYSLYPEYSSHMDWFTKSNTANFQAPVIASKKVFNKIFSIHETFVKLL